MKKIILLFVGSFVGFVIFNFIGGLMMTFLQILALFGPRDLPGLGLIGRIVTGFLFDIWYLVTSLLGLIFGAVFVLRQFKKGKENT